MHSGYEGALRGGGPRFGLRQGWRGGDGGDNEAHRVRAAALRGLPDLAPPRAQQLLRLPPLTPEADTTWTVSGASAALSLALRWGAASFLSVGCRARALQLYTYTLCDSPAKFFNVASASGLIRGLKDLKTAMGRGGDAPAFLVVNEDASNHANV